MPEWLMRGATVTKNGLLKQQGQRAYGLLSFTVRRGNFEIMDDETEREIEAGDWWLFDDVSQNHPFWFQKIDADADDDAARKQDVTICRQSLMCMDLRSGRWLGCELIGRSRDSYRAEDILRFFYRLFDHYGLPRRGIILERGIWKCKVITGERTVEVEISEDEKERVVGGLRQLGILVKHAYNAKGKGCIESGFRHFQNLCAGRIKGLCIGRKRGDRENGMKQFMRAQRGVVAPDAVGMLHIDKLSSELTRIMDVFNSEKKEGEIQNGVPEQVWQRSIKASPLLPMPADKAYLFMPVQRDVTIRGGHVEITVHGRALRFYATDFAIMGQGYRVRVYFDASQPTLVPRHAEGEG